MDLDRGRLGAFPVLPRRAAHGAFPDYVSVMFAQHSVRARLLLALRARRLYYAGQPAVSEAERRWEAEGGTSR